MGESKIQSNVRLAASKLGVKLFRNNIGKGWIGKSIVIKGNQMVSVVKGDVIIKNARRFHAGLYKGSSDLVGWKTVTITKDMVGHKVALFVSAEVKTAKGRVSRDQDHWLKTVNRAGGIAGVVRSAEDIENLLGP